MCANLHENAKREQLLFTEKYLYEAYILWIPPFGLLGGHHFYLRRYTMGTLYALTFGFCGIGLLVDLFRMPMLVREANSRRLQPINSKEVSMIDTYLLWIPPLGLIGAHHFYLGRPAWGVAYMFTLGFFGLGYLFDAFYIPCLVNETNAKLGHAGELEQPLTSEKRLATAYVLSLPPSGFLGCHQLYLENYVLFPIYACTFGLCGIGWVADIFRMPILLRRWKERQEGRLLYRKVYVDDAYLLLMPLGLLGMHHFYLRRYVFGVVYSLTLGMCGLGVLIDLFFIPKYVQRSNDEEEARFNARLLTAQHVRQGYQSHATTASAALSTAPTLSADRPPMPKDVEAGCHYGDEREQTGAGVVTCCPAPVAMVPRLPPFYSDVLPSYQHVTAPPAYQGVAGFSVRRT